MTRNRKVDVFELEREYVYDTTTPPVSFTDLAKRHGVARNTVAEPGTKGQWYEKRKAFRESLGMKVTEAMGEEMVKLEAMFRERVMGLGINYLAQYEAKLAANEIPMTTRDMLGVAAMMRTLTQDGASSVNPNAGPKIIDPDNEEHLPPDEYRRALAALEQLESGADAVDDPDAEEAGPEGSRPN